MTGCCHHAVFSSWCSELSDHPSSPPVAQWDVLAGVCCVMYVLYVVCSSIYFSCLFVQWAAHIPALQGFTKAPLYSQYAVLHPDGPFYRTLPSCATRKLFAPGDPQEVGVGWMLKTTHDVTDRI